MSWLIYCLVFVMLFVAAAYFEEQLEKRNKPQETKPTKKAVNDA